MKSILISVLSIFAIFSLSAQTRIKMKNEGGVYTIPCSVNGLKLRFIFDTGASNVCISLSEASFMLRNGYMNEEDVVGASSSQIADGRLVENTRVILREIEIEGIKLYNIEAIVMHNLSAPLLLGQSVIQKLGKIELNGDELVIFNGRSADSQKTTANFNNNSGPRWLKLYANGNVEIDLNSIEKIGGNKFRVWLKRTNLSKEEKQDLYIECKPMEYVQFGFRNEWKKIDNELQLFVFDCAENQVRVQTLIVFDTKGKVFGSKTDTNNSWSFFPPGSIADDIKKIYEEGLYLIK
jgi:clan AA aspartic protease (TIGR02281 family)